MACSMTSVISLVIVFSLITSLSLLSPTFASSSLNFTAIFAFGDSLLDPGNNNRLLTVVRGNHPPYGIDFPGHVASGRFTNGKLTTDFLVSNLGIKELLPAYLDPNITNKDLLTGVSFASAGSGLDELTGIELGIVAMGTQLKYFEEALQRMEREAGGERGATRIVKNALLVIGVGTNDMMYNFYDLPTRKLMYSLSEYQDFLLRKLEAFIRKLYNLGGRRLLAAGLPPIGCMPLQVTIDSLLPSNHKLQRVCSDQFNADSQAYNAKLQLLIPNLEASLPDAKLAYADVYTPVSDMIANPSQYGFERTLEGCCGTGTREMGPFCNSLTPTCPDPSKFLFWDAVHPGQAAYRFVVEHLEQTVLPHLQD